MEKIEIDFRFFPREASKEDDFFRDFLAKNYSIKINKNNPKYILFSNFSKGSRKIPIILSKATKIFWTGENVRTDMNKCDWAFAFEYEDKINSKNYLRFPLYAYYGAGKDLTKQKNPNEILAQKSKFCNYTYSKDAKERVEFFKELSKYKKIDAPGKSMNNTNPIVPQKLKHLLHPLQIAEKSITKRHTISALLSRHFGNWRQDIIEFQKQYKFTIAFENSSYPGYTTEKIYHPMLANSIPIYWGNPEIDRDFNTKSFVNWHEYNDTKKVADVVIDLDSNEKKYKKMLSQPYFKNNIPNKWCNKDRIKKQFDRIFGV